MTAGQVAYEAFIKQWFHDGASMIGVLDRWESRDGQTRLNWQIAAEAVFKWHEEQRKER